MEEALRCLLDGRIGEGKLSAEAVRALLSQEANDAAGDRGDGRGGGSGEV